MLFSAISAADPASLIEQLAQDWPAGDLQLVGDGLVWALDAGADATELARRCVRELRDRSNWGDDVLAEQLESRLGGDAARLPRLAVDLDDLADVLEGDPADGGGYIDLTTGEVLPEFSWEYLLEEGSLTPDEAEDPDRWLRVDCQGSRSGFGDMADFVATVEDEQLARDLDRALRGRRPFRAFKDTLMDSDVHSDVWFAFTNERKRGRARDWLATQGYHVEL